MPDSSLRILHLLRAFEVGGAESLALDVCRGLARRGHVVGLWALSNGPFQTVVDEAGLSHLSLNPEGQEFPWHLTLTRLVPALRKWKPDVVHAHNFQPLTRAVLARPLSHFALVQTKHGNVMPKLAGSSALSRCFYKRADAMVLVSEDHRGGFAEWSGMALEALYTVPNGVNTDIWVVPPRRKSQDAANTRDPVRLCIVARVVELKGIDTLLEAMRLTHTAGTPCELDIVGDGPARPELEAQARQLDIAQHVHFLGMRRDVQDILHRCDLFVLPSRTEAMPITILEAMATGLPVVATRVGGIPELVTDGVTGLLVPTDEPEALSQTMTKLIQNPDLRLRMGTAGRKRVEEELSLDTCVRRYEDLYREILRRKGRDV